MARHGILNKYGLFGMNYFIESLSIFFDCKLFTSYVLICLAFGLLWLERNYFIDGYISYKQTQNKWQLPLGVILIRSLLLDTNYSIWSTLYGYLCWFHFRDPSFFPNLLYYFTLYVHTNEGYLLYYFTTTLCHT